MFDPGRGRWVERHDVGEWRGQAGVVVQGVPAGEGETSYPTSQRPCAVWCVGGHDENLVACVDEVGDQAGDAAVPRVSDRSAAVTGVEHPPGGRQRTPSGVDE